MKSLGNILPNTSVRPSSIPSPHNYLPSLSKQDTSSAADDNRYACLSDAVDNKNSDSMVAPPPRLFGGLVHPSGCSPRQPEMSSSNKSDQLATLFLEQRQSLMHRYKAASKGEAIHFIFIPTRCQGLPPFSTAGYSQNRYLFECARVVTEFPDARITYVTTNPVDRDAFAELVRFHPESDKILNRTQFSARSYADALQ